VIGTVAGHQIRSMLRQGVFLVLLATLIVMTALAGALGWSSHHTIVGVYDVAVKLLADQGRPAPPNPFLLKPQLSLLSNMVVYIPLIGALLALVLGHLSLVDDETNGVGRLIFSRRISRTQYLAGKLFGASFVMVIILLASFVVSGISLVIVNMSVPSGADLLRLAFFFSLSWLYLMVFVLIGMIAVLVTRRRSLALLAGMGVWLVITFALPQITSGLRPAQSLNPIVDPVSTSQAFFKYTSKARPYSIVEQYKAASGVILRTATPESTASTLQRVAAPLGLLVILVAMAFGLARRHDYSTGSNNE
jgi:ABC-type transport system involved in multi-copper enzyme maturation permease subunit